ncbi:MAG: hypothetical protein RI955_1242 [Bacteroidota bacterium]
MYIENSENISLVGNRFYPLFMHYKPKQLFEVIVKKDDYEADAIVAAMALINEQNLQSSLEIVLGRNDDKKKQKEEEKLQKIKEKEEHYQQVSQFQDDGIVFSVSLDNVVNFEKRLNDEGIEYYRYDKISDYEVDALPTQNYYFNKRYAEEVNVICKELELVKLKVLESKKPIKYVEIYVLVGIVIIIAVMFKLLNIF